MALALALASCPLSAQPQPELLFQAEAQALSGACTGQPVRLDGNHNTLTLSGTCGSLLLRGVGNTVRLGVAGGGSIRVEGSGNRVEFAARGVPPAVVALGPDNDVAAAAAPSAPSTGAAVPADTPSLSPGTLVLAGDDQERLAQCAGQDVTITGRRSAYVLRGGCRSLTLRGDLLAVRVELLPGARVAVTGRGDVVTWVVLPRGRPPVAVVHGEGSRVQQDLGSSVTGR